MANLNDYIWLPSGTKNIAGTTISDNYLSTAWRIAGTTKDSDGNLCYKLNKQDPHDSSKTLQVTVYGDAISSSKVAENLLSNGTKVTKASEDKDITSKPTAYTVQNMDPKTRTAILTQNDKVTGASLNADDLNIITSSYIKSNLVLYDSDDTSTTSNTSNTESTTGDSSSDTNSDTSTDTSSDSDSNDNDSNSDDTSSDSTNDTVGVTTNTSNSDKQFTSDVRLLNTTYITENDQTYVLAVTNEGEVKIPVNDFNQYIEDANTALAFEEDLIKLLEGNVGNENLYYYSSRLFGIPHQFTPFTDYRLFNLLNGEAPAIETAGRKFVENIMLDAPVLTVIPGKPLYLPGNKDKQASTIALIQASNGSLSLLAAADKVGDNSKLIEKLRYYDFQPDYYNYMRYVNVMCAVGAVFLDLGDETIDGIKFTKYDWKNYRWLASNYSVAIGRIGAATKNTIYKTLTGTVDKIVSFGGSVLESLSGRELAGVGGLENIEDTDGATETDADNSDAVTDTENTTTGLTENSSTTEDNDLLASLETLLTSMNYVQFYIDPTSSVQESSSNTAGDSQLSGIFSSVSDIAKEINFAMNSGGADLSGLQNAIDSGLDALSSSITKNTSGTFSSVLTRIMSNAGNVMKGETMVFPKIYQSSDYQKSYSVTINLVCVYGNKLSYYLNVLVPLFHIMALALPKQSSANTYSTPFLIRAYYPGTFSCNLGLVSSLTISKNPNGDAWTMDGYPSNVSVTLSIDDLYSDLSMTPSGDVIGFFANSSLVEYIATSCGINLTVPQLKKRIELVTAAFDTSVTNIKTSVTQGIWQNAERFVQSFAGI